jgi:hypothetical protein
MVEILFLIFLRPLIQAIGDIIAERKRNKILKHRLNNFERRFSKRFREKRR